MRFPSAPGIWLRQRCSEAARLTQLLQLRQLLVNLALQFCPLRELVLTTRRTQFSFRRQDRFLERSLTFIKGREEEGSIHGEREVDQDFFAHPSDGLCDQDGQEDLPGELHGCAVGDIGASG